MKTFATVLLTLLLALPASAATIHDEGVDGDLSSDPAAPTALAFALGGNTIIGSVEDSSDPRGDRDYITFTIPPNQMLTALNMVAFAPVNVAFMAFNTGATSFIPSAATNASFLAGIHPSGSEVGSNLMPLFVSSSVTTNSLPSPELGPGTYCFMVQQTTPIVQTYELEFVLTQSVPVEPSTWGSVKAVYRD